MTSLRFLADAVIFSRQKDVLCSPNGKKLLKTLP